VRTPVKATAPRSGSPFGPYTADATAARPLVVFAHKGHDWIRGSEQCLLDLLSGIDRELFRLLVLTNGTVLADEAERRGVEAVRVEHWSGGAIVNVLARHRVSRLLRDRGAALVHANMAVTLPLVIPTARRLGIPVLTHLHIPYSSLRERHRALVRQSTMTVGVAEHVVAPLRAGMFVPSRVRVVDNAVNADHLAGGDATGLRPSLGIAPTAFVAATVGSLIERKGQRAIVRAIAIAREQGLDAHVLLCGDGEDEPMLRALSATLGVTGAVHFLGMRRDVGAILVDATDVLVSTAREEAQPLSVLEAQWLGVPVLASDIVAHRQALSRPDAALFPLDDAPALARALAAMAAERAPWRAAAAASQATARERYDMRRYVETFQSLYGELLSDAARARESNPTRRETGLAARPVLRTT
jgi:glycosyltransferase involved in cell wall biosynthesis